MQRKTKRSAAQMRAKAAVRNTNPLPAKRAPAKSSRDKVRAYRKRMRAKGLRLVQMWVPDAKEPNPAGAAGQTKRVGRADAAAIRKAWAEALAPATPGHVPTFAAIAHLVGSVDGLPSDLSTRKKHYLKLYGYGRKRAR
jgi:Protein  of unknown function (DUF3018)